MMHAPLSRKDSETTHLPCFATTHWGVVLAAGQSSDTQASAALEELCRTYWYPLYAYVRRQGVGPADAQDLTQGFFARLLAKDYLARVERQKGKFRSFLLAALRHFLSDQRDRERALKRGVAPDSELYPDRVAIPLQQVFRRLHALHGTTWFERQGREIGAFVLHYGNGAVTELPVVFGEHLRREHPRRDPRPGYSSGQLVWGAGSSADPADDRPRLYRTTFLNPKPKLEVLSIDYVSKLTRCGPFLVALTVE